MASLRFFQPMKEEIFDSNRASSSASPSIVPLSSGSRLTQDQKWLIHHLRIAQPCKELLWRQSPYRYRQAPRSLNQKCFREKQYLPCLAAWSRRNICYYEKNLPKRCTDTDCACRSCRVRLNRCRRIGAKDVRGSTLMPRMSQAPPWTWRSWNKLIRRLPSFEGLHR